MKGRGRGPRAGGRQTPTRPSWERAQSQRWVAGAAWASSSWGAASQAIAVVNQRDENECALAVHSDPVGYMWAGITLVAFVCLLFVGACFILGRQCSNYWKDRREATRIVVEPVPPRPRAMRERGRRNKSTQCKRPCTDIGKISRLTIHAIRLELASYGESTNGTKIEVAERLRLRRIRNEESAERRQREDFSSDSGGE